MKNVEECLTTEFKSRKELRAESGLSDRQLRREISLLKKKRPVIYDSSKRGYRLARPLDELTALELVDERDAVLHCIRDIEARKSALSSYENSYIAYLAVAEKKLKRVEA